MSARVPRETPPAPYSWHQTAGGQPGMIPTLTQRRTDCESLTEMSDAETLATTVTGPLVAGWDPPTISIPLFSLPLVRCWVLRKVAVALRSHCVRLSSRPVPARGLDCRRSRWRADSHRSLFDLHPMSTTSSCSSSRASFSSESDLRGKANNWNEIFNLAYHNEIGEIPRGVWCWNRATATSGTCQFSMMLAPRRCSLIWPIYPNASLSLEDLPRTSMRLCAPFVCNFVEENDQVDMTRQLLTEPAFLVLDTRLHVPTKRFWTLPWLESPCQ